MSTITAAEITVGQTVKCQPDGWIYEVTSVRTTDDGTVIVEGSGKVGGYLKTDEVKVLSESPKASTDYVESFVDVDALARRMFVVLKARGIGFGVHAYDDLSDNQKEIYRNDARSILLMEHLEVTA